MEERKTAAIVLGIIGLVVIFFTVILPEIRFRSTQTVSFKNCRIQFKYWDKDYVTDINRVAQNKLALCLCNSYQIKPDTAVANHIIQIYKQFDNYDSIRFNYTIDSIIKHKKTVLDTTVSID
jgi:hypothetical protein